MILSLGTCRVYGEPIRICNAGGLRREWGGSRSGERSGERGEDAKVGVEGYALKPSYSEWGQPARRLNRAHIPFTTHRLPETKEALLELRPLEFQNWVIDAVYGVHAPRRTGDMGIDGYSFFERLPIQVKQQESVGRKVVDEFETAIRRDGSHKGFIFAFSFTRGAHGEVARARSEGLEIELVDIQTLLDNPPDEVEPTADFSDMLTDLYREAERAKAKHASRAPKPRELTIEDLTPAGVETAE